MIRNHHFLFSGLAFLLLFACTNIASNSTYPFENEPVVLDAVLFADRGRAAVRDTSFETKHFQFKFVETFLLTSELEEIALNIEKNAVHLFDFLKENIREGKVKYTIYSNIEKKGLNLQDGSPAQLDYSKEIIYAVVGDVFEGHKLHVENELFLRKQLGQPKHSFLEKGLAVYLNEEWQREGWNHWAARLFTSNNMPPLSELLDEDLFEKESELVMNCTAASFIDFLINKKGKTAFLDTYANLTIRDDQVEILQQEWLTFLKKKYAIFEKVSKAKGLPWLKGFNFAHEGYRIYNGYGSDLALQSMKEMLAMGSNSLAIVPYSFMRSTDKPSFLPIMRRAGSETDESVIATHVQAKKQAAFTMLKPQIWMRGSWPGGIEMTTEADWDAFFDYYHRWMRHYAMIAEIWHFDVLCVGVEFAKATQAHPQKWRDLIKKMRGIYSGPLTYAANWGDEFEKISFWDDLDYIGLNCYYPLSKKKTASQEELIAGFEKTVQKIEKISHRYGKKIIFTEIGFRSVEAPWMQPHEEANGKDSNNEHQAECYKIVFDAINGKAWCNGILWWKWPSHLDYNRQGTKGFSPSGKEAQVVVEDNFKMPK